MTRRTSTAEGRLPPAARTAGTQAYEASDRPPGALRVGAVLPSAARPSRYFDAVCGVSANSSTSGGRSPARLPDTSVRGSIDRRRPRSPSPCWNSVSRSGLHAQVVVERQADRRDHRSRRREPSAHTRPGRRGAVAARRRAGGTSSRPTPDRQSRPPADRDVTGQARPALRQHGRLPHLALEESARFLAVAPNAVFAAPERAAAVEDVVAGVVEVDAGRLILVAPRAAAIAGLDRGWRGPSPRMPAAIAGSSRNLISGADGRMSRMCAMSLVGYGGNRAVVTRFLRGYRNVTALP